MDCVRLPSSATASPSTSRHSIDAAALGSAAFRNDYCIAQRGDYQVHCGPALGSFNQWVKSTPLEAWRNRRVADIGERIMRGAARILEERLRRCAGAAS